MGGRAAEFRDHAGNLWQHMAKRRPGNPRHQNVAWRDAGELAFAVDHDGAAGAPANASWMTIEARMPQPDVVGHHGGCNGERTRLQELEAVVVERPFNLDR